MFGLLSFTTPWLLTSLIGLPILWWLLRAVPPAPIRRRFPGVALLLGLQDEDTVVDRTPWWLMLLRMLLIAFAIIGLSGPVLNPDETETSNQPLLVLLDGSWATADDWPAQSETLTALLEEVDRNGRAAAIVRLTTPEQPEFLQAAIWARRVQDFAPQPWRPKNADVDALIDLLQDESFDTYWLSDGLAYDGRSKLIQELESRGSLRVVQSPKPVFAINDVTFQDGVLSVTSQSSQGGPIQQAISIIGPDPNGLERTLATGSAIFADGETAATTEFSLPAELRGRIARFEIQGFDTAGSVYLADDALRRREIAIIATRTQREGLELLSPSHYLNKALIETAELITGSISDVLPANPDVIILADIATMTPTEENALIDWTDEGGLLLRFAGPAMAASDVSRTEEHPLMPVRLRVGGRTVGGAMSWGEPKTLAPFAVDSPFYGLDVPSDVSVRAQVVAQPDPNLADRVLAELSDGTPLVTRKAIGQGQVILFHVTANAEWSGLPLSGLFVQMLDRLAVLSASRDELDDIMQGTTWQPLRVLEGSGRIIDGQTLPGVAGETLASGPLGTGLRPGLYKDGDRTFARNTFAPDEKLTPFAWPARINVQGLERPATRDLTREFLTAALVLLLLDTLVSLMLSGRLRGFGLTASVVLALSLPTDGFSQSNNPAAEVTLGYVITRDTRVDQASFQGLRGLSQTLNNRTSVEPVTPVGVDLETDELAFFPFLYWPITTSQPTPSDDAYQKLNQYLRSGGMILFDTRDADVARLGSGSPNGRKLQQLARPLDIPGLEPIPDDHVLTRTFYLLQDFPGRYAGQEIWVEAAPPDAERAEGMPFRNLNDGVTPVVIGGNDWAAAWARLDNGTYAFPVGRGTSGARQRELAYRFGVNLIMHVLSGNYKSDQVHVPALLDRLGQ